MKAAAESPFQHTRTLTWVIRIVKRRIRELRTEQRQGPCTRHNKGPWTPARQSGMNNALIADKKAQSPDRTTTIWQGKKGPRTMLMRNRTKVHDRDKRRRRVPKKNKGQQQNPSTRHIKKNLTNALKSKRRKNKKVADRANKEASHKSNNHKTLKHSPQEYKLSVKHKINQKQ